MKIYAIRDRLINYYMQPFAGPEDGAVMAAIARTINNGDATSDVAQAPHHFEIWRLGQVTEDGHLVPERELVCDCASLVRRSVRPNGDGHLDEAAEAALGSRRAAAGAQGATRASDSALQGQAPGEGSPGAEVRHGPAGGYPPRGES